MQELEKILEEVERLEDPYYKDYVDRKYVKEIIHSHMGGATDTDDTEEKIREHIAECLHRIDNIRSFIGSKEYTSNDEKCIRNIEVLKTSITALEEYLSSKKKNGNNGWIPVEEQLPEEKEGAIRTFKQLMKSLYLVTDGRGVIIALFDDGHFIDVDDYIPYEKVIAWRPLPEPYKPKKLQTEEKPVQ